MTDAGETTRRTGFRGTRNTDTTAATRALQTKARRRKIEEAEALLSDAGYLIVGPRERGFIQSGDDDLGVRALRRVEAIVKALRTS